MEFEEFLYRELEKQPPSFAKSRLMRILDSPDSRRRDRVLQVIESHARVKAGLPLDAGASVDWQQSGLDIAGFMQLLMQLLPFLLSLFGK